MQKFTLLSLFGLLAVSIANAALLDSTLPQDYALILSRQAPGTPQYECHSNCGNVHSLTFPLPHILLPLPLSTHHITDTDISPPSVQVTPSPAVATQPIAPT
jgi:hypothetical protein